MRRLRHVLVLVLVALGAGCTPGEINAWVAWYGTDPAGATEFVNRPEVQAELVEPVVAVEQASRRWDRIAYCESGGQWDYPPVRGGRGQLYSGGLMIWTKAWVAYGGQEFAPQAWQASKAEQIVIAERILADNGWGAWDCA